MERRAGGEFDFNEPLLERALSGIAGDAGPGDVVILPLFFSPGRHAGPGGDIAVICEAARERHPGLRIHRTALVGEHPLLVEILADRAIACRTDARAVAVYG
jgi:sirohydrochlorin ferrochelatase